MACIHNCPITVRCPECDKYSNTKLHQLLREALAALEDLGACNDPHCKEPNCDHAATNIRQYLQSWRVIP